MYQTINGFYENGQVIFNEPVSFNEKVPIMVTFLEDIPQKSNTKNVVKFGGFEGMITISEDFDEPLDDLKEYMY